MSGRGEVRRGLGGRGGSEEEDRHRWRRFPLFVAGQWRLVSVLIVLSMLAGFCQSVILALIAQSAAALATGHQTVSSSRFGALGVHGSVDRLLAIALVFAGIWTLLSLPLSYLPARILSRVQSNTRRRILEAYTRASWSVQSQDGEGTFQEVMSGQMIQFTGGAGSVVAILTAACTLVVLVGVALVLDPLAAVLVIGVATILSSSLRPLTRLGRQNAKALSAAQVLFARGIAHSVSLAEEVQVFGAGEAQRRQIGEAIDEVQHRVLVSGFLGRVVPNTYQAVILLLVTGGLSVLAATNTNHLVSLGAVVLLLIRASSYGQSLQSSYQSLNQSLPFLDRVMGAERRYRDGVPVRGSRTLSRTPSIAFSDVSYSYGTRTSNGENTPALSGISFTVLPGRVVGVVGPTGAGKSTLVQLLLGLREPDTGRYLLDGKNASTLSSQGWTTAFSYVPQEPKLLRGTVKDNIAFYRDLDDATIETSARLAHIHDDIMTWPLGYDTVIGQRADAVSGGQRQRICLARALAANPLVLVLDEPTSALDPRSEALVQESLTELKGEMTMFVIAHRFSTLAICDDVMIIQEGHLDGFGPASEVRTTNTFYKEAAAIAAHHGPGTTR